MINSPVQQIKEKLDIVDFIRSYIPLLPAGKNFKAVCPFHKEKTPSFIVSPDRQTWHCFGACSEGGDIFKFLMKHENLEFYEALKVLAEKAGIELRRSSPAEYKQFGILYDLNALAKDFFKKQLERSPAVLDYFKERGLKKETIEEFELGWAPESFEALSMDLITLGHDVKDAERAGLIFKNDRGRYTDRFRSRIMFPIYNSFGKVVGFSGRILNQTTDYGLQTTAVDRSPSTVDRDIAKYINSPETPIFNKSRIFYGLHKTKNAIKEQGAAVLVEGQMDFLALYQDGIKNVVATSGTALTADHLKSLKRLTDQLILSFDNDEAGFRAAERSIDLAGASDFNVRLLVVEGYKDPAEAVQKSPGKIIELVHETKPAMEFYFERYLANADLRGLKADQRGSYLPNFKKNLRVILAKIKNLASPIEQAHWIKELSGRVQISEKALVEEMEQLMARKDAEKGAEPRGNILRESATTRREIIAQRILSLLMVREELKNAVTDYVQYLPGDYAIILGNMIRGDEAIEESLLDLWNTLSLRSSLELEKLEREKINEEFELLLREIKSEFLKERRNELMSLIKEAEAAGEENRVKGVLKEFDDISKMIENKGLN
ncbi:DNA primase [Candidatus Wolfebacteria bacterium]|nr:DNA primase [Candidatus Wolfebacteria bacterium]